MNQDGSPLKSQPLLLKSQVLLRGRATEFAYDRLISRRLAQQPARDLPQPVDGLGRQHEARGQVHKIGAFLRIRDGVKGKVERLHSDLRHARFRLRLGLAREARLRDQELASPFYNFRFCPQ